MVMRKSHFDDKRSNPPLPPSSVLLLLRWDHKINLRWGEGNIEGTRSQVPCQVVGTPHLHLPGLPGLQICSAQELHAPPFRARCMPAGPVNDHPWNDRPGPGQAQATHSISRPPQALPVHLVNLVLQISTHGLWSLRALSLQPQPNKTRTQHFQAVPARRSLNLHQQGHDLILSDRPCDA